MSRQEINYIFSTQRTMYLEKLKWHDLKPLFLASTCPKHSPLSTTLISERSLVPNLANKPLLPFLEKNNPTSFPYLVGCRAFLILFSRARLRTRRINKSTIWQASNFLFSGKNISATFFLESYKVILTTFNLCNKNQRITYTYNFTHDFNVSLTW